MILQNVLSGLGIFGLFIVILALMLFSFYLQLVIAKSSDNLALLMTLGYSPRWLSRMVAKRFIPVYIVVVIGALVITQFFQWSFHVFFMKGRPEISSLIHWSLFVAAGLLTVLSILTNYRMVRKLLHNFASRPNN